MNKEKLTELYKKYNLTKDDFFKHQHYTIITRQGIDKIQALEQMSVNYEVIKCEPILQYLKHLQKKMVKAYKPLVVRLKAKATRMATPTAGTLPRWQRNEQCQERY